jgi:mRNA interferase RelE/StbE
VPTAAKQDGSEYRPYLNQMASMKVGAVQDRQSAIRILDFMDERISKGENPRSLGKILTGPKLGSYWRYRVSNYRIICDIQDGQLCVLVIEIGDRKEIYG